MAKEVKFSEEQWQAEQIVEKALMNTSLAKKQVKAVVKSLKAQKAKVQKAIKKIK